MSIPFSRVRQLLDSIMVDWTNQHHRAADLPGLHADPNFGWSTREQLLKAEAFGFRLVDPVLVGNGKGHQTNLVLALTNGILSMPQMPSRGPYLSDENVHTIIEWIDSGCPDDTEYESRAVAADVEQTVEMDMRDPDVNKQSDIAPYPNGPGKLLHKWAVTVGFEDLVGDQIRIRVRGIPGGSAGVRPGNIFDAIVADDVFQNTGYVYDGNDSQGCLVLQRASFLPTSSPPYDPNLNQFPDPALTYPFRTMVRNGRWFLVQWSITHHGGRPNLLLSATQQPRVATVADRRCPP